MKQKILLLQLLTISFFSFATSKDTSKVEWIKTYFNSISDHSVAWENNNSRDHWDMIQPLLDRIDSANYSIDLVAYDLQNMRVGHALAKAARRGVRVRVITDDSNRERNPRFNTPMWDTLRTAGIYSIDDAGTIYKLDGEIIKLPEKLPNAGAIMHHKYVVFDVLDPDPNDDYVWTGSMNLTYTGNWNTNVTFVIKDSGIAEAYNDEFEQMWGGDKKEPNAKKAKFHKNKHHIRKSNIHFVNDIKIEVYFSPMDKDKQKPSISKRITELINEAKHDVHFLSFAISPKINISKAMIDRSGRGEITLKGVIDPAFYARYRNLNEIWAKPEMSFGNRLVLPGKEVRKLHAKTIIIDAEYPYPEKHKAITIAGSYNFSDAAELSNDENILMIHDNKIANQFLQDWTGVMNRAQGKSFHRFPELDTSKWYDNFSIDKNGQIAVEFTTGLKYPVSLLGVDVPRTWAGHKDSTYYYSDEAVQHLRKLVKGTSLKITSGKEMPTHKFGRYYGYITAKKGDEIIDINREMIVTGNATYSKWNRQQKDSIMAFKFLEQKARENKLGLWAFPDSIGLKKLTRDAQMRKSLFPLNINVATPEQLTLIPSIGPATAEAIIEYRDKKGKITNLNELTKIRGIGAASLKKLEPYIVMNEEERIKSKSMKESEDNTNSEIDEESLEYDTEEN